MDNNYNQHPPQSDYQGCENNYNQNTPQGNNYQNYQQNPNNRPTVPPKSWLLESILVTLFCCLPFGIVGIVNASKVENLFYSGNIDEANRISREAKKWTMIGFWVGLGVSVLYGIGMMFSMLLGLSYA